MDGPRSLGPKDPRRFDYNSATTVVLRLLTPSVSSSEGARVTSLLISRMFSTTEEDLSPTSSTTAPLLIRPNLCIEVGKATCKKFSMRSLFRSIFSSRNVFNSKNMTLAMCGVEIQNSKNSTFEKSLKFDECFNGKQIEKSHVCQGRCQKISGFLAYKVTLWPNSKSPHKLDMHVKQPKPSVGTFCDSMIALIFSMNIFQYSRYDKNRPK